MRANQTAAIGTGVGQRTLAQPQPTAEQQYAMDEIKRIRAHRNAIAAKPTTPGKGDNRVTYDVEAIANSEAVCDQMVAAGRVKIIGRSTA